MKARVRDWGRTGYSLAAIRDLARRTLPHAVFDFADGGAEDEQTLRRNEATFAQIWPRPHGVGDRLSIEPSARARDGPRPTISGSPA